MWLFNCCIFIVIFSVSYGGIIHATKNKEENKTLILEKLEAASAKFNTEWSETTDTSTPYWPETTQTTSSWPETTETTPYWPETTQTTSSWPETTETTSSWPETTQTSTPYWPETTETTSSWPETTQTSTPYWPETTETTSSWPETTQTSTPYWPETTETTSSWPETTETTPYWPETTETTPSWPETTQTTPYWPETTETTPYWPETTETTPYWTETTETTTPSWTDSPTTTWTDETTPDETTPSQSTTEEFTTPEMTTTVPVHEIFYLLYNRNVRQRIFTSLDQNIPLDPDANTVFLIHDHGGSAGDRFSMVVRRALEKNNNFNIFEMNWSDLSVNYEQAIANYRRAAEDLFKFLEIVRLNKIEQNNRDLHLIGFGIGSHVAGYAGNILKNVSQVGRITGLSPSRMEGLNGTYILDQLDAAYVEIIHTNNDETGSGIIGQIGDVDFYPNGGAQQPGCWTHRCSHERSYELFQASLEYDHLVGQRCIDINQMHDDNCSGFRLSLGGAEIMKVPMLPGIYRLNTEPIFPFKLI